METKAQIRKSYKQKRAMLNEESVRVMSEAICAAVENSAWYHEAECVGFYYPLGSEVQLTGLVTKAWAAGRRMLSCDGTGRILCRTRSAGADLNSRRGI